MLTLACLGLFFVGDAQANPYHLKFSGDSGTTFTGSCIIGDGKGEATLSFAGRVPAERTVTGDSLDCRLEALGRMILDIRHGTSRTRSSTSGGVLRLKMSGSSKDRTPH